MKIDPIKSAMLSDGEKERIRRLGAMETIISAMISSEDRYGKAMTQEQIAKAFLFPGLSTEALLSHMSELGYIVCSVSDGPKECKETVTVKTPVFAWGTTFFGREWQRGIQDATLP